jgi:hypothetical protein
MTAGYSRSGAPFIPSKSGLFGLTKTLAKEVAFMLERAGKLTDDVVLTHSRGPLAQVGLMLGLLEQELPAASPGCLPFHQAPPTRERPDSQMARRWIR